MAQYTESEKREAVRAYVLYGTYDRAEAVTGIPKETLACWKHRDPEWWDRTVAEITLQALEDLTDPDQHALRRIRSNVIKQLEARIEHGDKKLNVKTGEMVDVPITANDLAKILPVVGASLETVTKAVVDPEKVRQERNEEFARIAREEREARQKAN